MTIIFTGKTHQITYENGKFYEHTKFPQQQDFPPTTKKEIISPLPYVSTQLEGNDGKKYAIGIVQNMGHTSIYQCCFESTGLVYKQSNDYDNGLITHAAWTPISSQIQNTVANYFWQKEKSHIPNEAPSQNQVSQGQKSQIKQTLLEGIGLAGTSLQTIKTASQSRKEYEHCLTYLIEANSNPDQSLSHELVQQLNGFKALIASPDTFLNLPLNASTYYDGHIATTGEVFEYIRDFLVAELKTNQPAYQAPPMNLQDPKWNNLCSPGTDVPNATEAVKEQAKQILQNIVAISEFNPDNFPSLKAETTETQFINAIKAINVINAIKVINATSATDWSSPLGQYLKPFGAQICISLNIGNANTLRNPGTAREAFNVFRDQYLKPLHETALAALNAHYQNNQIVQQRAEQFIPLRVDQLNPTGIATHADFVKFQLEHPQAILLIPDNFTDAALPDNQRHLRALRGGLAGPMAPRNLGTNPQPLYDLCTLGIPTGGDATLNPQAQQTKVKEYFARLYGEIRCGRTIAVPRTQRNGVEEWAFGGGFFAHSPLTQFVQQELTKLQRFCNGGVQLQDLDEKYQTAWMTRQPSLPLPAFQMPEEELAPAPQPAPAPADHLPEGIQADRNLTNPGFREKLKEWLQENGHSTLEENKGAYRATLSNGIQMAVYQDKILVVKPSGELTDAELRDSITKIIDAYKHAHAPGNPPPLKAYGTEKQKEVIRELITSAGIPLLREGNEPGPQNAEANANNNPPRINL